MVLCELFDKVGSWHQNRAKGSPLFRFWTKGNNLLSNCGQKEENFCLKRSILNESVSRTRQLWKILHRRQKSKCPQYLRPFPKFRLEPLPQHLRPWYQVVQLTICSNWIHVPWTLTWTDNNISCSEIYWDMENSCKTQIYPSPSTFLGWWSANTAESFPQQQSGLKPCASWQGLVWWPPPPKRLLGGGSWPWGWRRRWRGRGEHNGRRRWRAQGGQGEATATQCLKDCS